MEAGAGAANVIVTRFEKDPVIITYGPGGGRGPNPGFGHLGIWEFGNLGFGVVGDPRSPFGA